MPTKKQHTPTPHNQEAEGGTRHPCGASRRTARCRPTASSSASAGIARGTIRGRNTSSQKSLKTQAFLTDGAMGLQAQLFAPPRIAHPTFLDS
jgi:hypothetical protein